MGALLETAPAFESFTGARVEGPEVDSLLDLSFRNTLLALLMNLEKPRGLSSDPPGPPADEPIL